MIFLPPVNRTNTYLEKKFLDYEQSLRHLKRVIRMGLSRYIEHSNLEGALLNQGLKGEIYGSKSTEDEDP